MILAPYLRQYYDSEFETFLTSQDPKPFTVLNADANSQCILTIDHASATIPDIFGNFDLAPAELNRHIAYDIGAFELGAYLSDSLESVAISSGFSRLVMDVNRFPEDSSAFPSISDQTKIFLNQKLSQTQRQRRIQSLFIPYHQAIWQQIERRIHGGRQIIYLNIHTCTDRMNGVYRPWEIGVLWDKDDRIAKPLIDILRQQTDLCIGDNKPYSGAEPKGYSVMAHAENFDYPHVAIEVRQDLVSDQQGIQKFGKILTRAFQAVLPTLNV